MSNAVAARRAAVWPRVLPVLLGAGGAIGTLAVVLGGQPPAERASTAPLRWPVADVHTLPDSWRRLGPALAWAGAVLVIGLWLVVLRLVIGRRVDPQRAESRPDAAAQLTSRSVLGMAAAWAAPLVLGPPVLSADAYSYLAQGEMLRRGLDPYRLGISALGSTPVVAAVDARWRDAPSPYGPLGLAVSRLAAEIGSSSLVVGVVVLRLLAVAGVVLALCCAARLARDAARPVVLALIAGNPIVLLHLVGGAHLDAMVMGLVLAALLASARGHPLMGVGLATAAASVKVPALVVVAVLFLVAVFAELPGRRPRRRVLAVGGVVLGTALACAALVPDGFGWLRTLSTPGQGRTEVAPTALVASALSAVLRLPPAGTLLACRLLGIILAALLVLALLGTFRRRSPASTAGLGQLVVALLGPVTYVWYLASPVAALAPRSRDRGRIALAGLCAAASLTSLPSLSTPAFPWPSPPALAASPAPTASGRSTTAAIPGTAIPESLTRPPRVTATPAASSPSARPGTARIAPSCGRRPPRTTITASPATSSRIRLNGLASSECPAASR